MVSMVTKKKKQQDFEFNAGSYPQWLYFELFTKQ